ncbi:MAG TPA: hypothetical protein H9755_07410 [Candidatus Dietzia intestinigallinarum]|nr:hypothetical protein [Candidatus Dietzia intestinigallinarum]
MKRMLVRVALFLGSVAVALLVAWLLLGADFRVTVLGFITAVIVFSVAQVAVSPVVDKLARRYAEPLLGGVGLISTFIALLVATLLSGGLRIHGVSTWIAATLIVWLVTALATLVVPRLLAKILGDSTTGSKGDARAGRAR